MSHRKNAASLYLELGPLVYRCCFRFLQDREAAQDATQEVFIRLLRSGTSLESGEKLVAWIVRVARNHCMNLRRHLRHDETFSRDLEPDESTSPDLASRLLARTLLERFDLGTQRAALAVLASGMSYREAGTLLNVAPSTVARRVQRFLASARTYLASEQVPATGAGSKAVPAGSRAAGPRDPVAAEPVAREQAADGSAPAAPQKRAGADWRAMLAKSKKSAA